VCLLFYLFVVVKLRVVTIWAEAIISVYLPPVGLGIFAPQKSLVLGWAKIALKNDLDAHLRTKPMLRNQRIQAMRGQNGSHRYRIPAHGGFLDDADTGADLDMGLVLVPPEIYGDDLFLTF
jgi:hypothetical protein